MRLLLAAVVAFAASVNAAIMTVDLGSEFLKVGMLSRGKPIQIVENIASKRKSEAVVAFDKSDVRSFSNGALKLSTRFPRRTFRFLPTLIGQEYASEAVRVFQKRFPFHNLTADERGMVQITDDDGVTHSVEEYVAMLLQFCVDITTKFSGEAVKSSIITVPPYYTQVERTAIYTSAKLIDLKVSQLLNSDLAAALNFGSFRADEFKKKPQKMVIYDMGSTSVTASLFKYRWTKNKEIGRQQPTLEVLASVYDRNLGGLDFDFVVREILVERFHEMKGVKEDITKNERAMARLLIEAEKVKKVLSANKQTTCYIENLAEDKDFKAVITREEFEQRTETLLARTPLTLRKLLAEIGRQDDKLELSDIASVIVIGGGSRIPKVLSLLKEAIDGRDLDFNLNGDEAIALGAAYRAADVSPSHRVPQKWTVRSIGLFPIHVAFVRPGHTGDDGTVYEAKEVSKVLFGRFNGLPQKKTMTFTKHREDFELSVYYDDLDVLESQESFFGGRNLTTVQVKLTAALQDQDLATFDSVKVHFVMDSSGVLAVDGIEAVFNASKAAAEDEGMLGGMFNNLWGSDEEAKDEPAGAENGEPKAEDEVFPEAAEETEPAAEETEQASTEGEGKADTPKEEVDDNKAEEQPETKEKDKETEKPKEPKKRRDKKNAKDDGIVKQNIQYEMTAPTEQTSLDKALFDNSYKYLAAMAKVDRERLERASANSELEAYALDCRMKLFEDAWEEVTTEDERMTIKEQSNEVSEWLYEDGMEASTQEYRAKLLELKQLMAPALRRKTEREERPKVVAKLEEIINVTSTFVNTSRHNETWRKAEDIDALELLMNTTEEWLEEQTTLQAAVEANVDPLMTVDMVKKQADDLARKMVQEMKRAPPPPPPPKKEKKTKKEDTNESQGDADGDIEEDNDAETTAEDADDAAGSADKAEGSEDTESNEEPPASEPADGEGEDPLAEEAEEPTTETDDREEL